MMVENNGYLRRRVLMISLLLALSAGAAFAQTTSFTYQGRLTDGGTAASGNYDLQFTLFDSLAGGAQIGATQTIPNVLVSAGIFTVQLDFGASAFPGANRFLEIGARLTGTASFTTLSPRQQITSTPYAIRSLNASTADAVIVNGVPGGSGNYIQNATTPQANSNFNISGNGTAGGTLAANIVNAATQYNLGGSRVLSVAGSRNIFAGTNAGTTNTSGNFNSFFGSDAGASNTNGSNNSFFGGSAGENNTTGHENSFFGNLAGFENTEGIQNSFFGLNAGGNNTKGSFNTFFGYDAGVFNGVANNNAFFGYAAGESNLQGSNNTLVGTLADVGSGNLTNVTAIGSRARVDQSDSLVLGSIAGLNGATSSVKVGIGTTTPLATLHVKGNTLIETSGSGGNIQFGTPNSETGMTVIKGTTSRFDMRFDGSTLKLVALAGNPVGVPPSTNGLAIDLGGNVGIGTTTPVRRLDVSGMVRVGVIPLQASTGSVCINSAGDLLTCGASSLRWKTNVRPFLGGLDIVRRLRPINFNWKESGLPDIGLGAEDVAKVAPSLTFVNSKGEAEGVKYERLNVVLINAIKQQQEEINRQQSAIDLLTTANAGLSARLRVVEGRLRPKARSARRVVRSRAQREQ